MNHFFPNIIDIYTVETKESLLMILQQFLFLSRMINYSTHDLRLNLKLKLEQFVMLQNKIGV